MRCEADENYTIFYTAQGEKHIVSKTLRYYEELLEPSSFIRVHRSHLVNMAYIAKLNRREDYIELTDGSKVQISSRKKGEVNDILSRFL
jgi:two-component system, LytTR family, response regulator